MPEYRRFSKDDKEENQKASKREKGYCVIFFKIWIYRSGKRVQEKP